MIRVELNYNEKIKIINRLKSIWDIGEHYWYPLSKCARTDLIAFDSKYIINHKKLGAIKEILSTFGVERIFELRENGLVYEISKMKEYGLWESDEYFWNNEGFWFDHRMNWIIYISHEEIITFGGQLLTERIKSEWSDWKHHLKWDSINQY